MTADTNTEDAEIDLHPRFSRNLIGHDAVLDQINISGEGVRIRVSVLWPAWCRQGIGCMDACRTAFVTGISR